MDNIEKCEYEISVVKAKQYSSTYKHILMINGVPAVIVRGNQSLSDCISYFMNGEPELKDGKIMKILDNIKKGGANGWYFKVRTTGGLTIDKCVLLWYNNIVRVRDLHNILIW